MRARSGASATPRGGGMRCTTASSSSGTLVPSLAEMRRISSAFAPMSSCSSCARRSGSAPGRSILLRTGMISSPASIARNRLESVCAWIPCDASTTRLAPQVHRVEDLFSHQTLVERARELDEAVGQGRLAVVDVGHDTEVADVILAHVGLKYSHPPAYSVVARRLRMTAAREHGILREEFPWLPSPA